MSGDGTLATAGQLGIKPACGAVLVCSVACLEWVRRGLSKDMKSALQKRLEEDHRLLRKAPRLFAIATFSKDCSAD